MHESGRTERRAELEGGGRARRGGAGSLGRVKDQGQSEFQAIEEGNHLQGGWRHGKRGAGGGTKLTRVRTAWARTQVRAKMELCREEDDPEQDTSDDGDDFHGVMIRL